jgi:hypothetical protein
MYSFPNANDDLKTQITYTVGAEFLYRLDLFLEVEYRDSDDGSVPLATIETVQQCSEAALALVCQLPSGTRRPLHHFETPSSANATAAKISAGVVQVLQDRLQNAPLAESADCARLPKWELMFIVCGEFFLLLGAMAELVLARSEGVVCEQDVLMLLGCIDAGMGMVYELAEVTWASGQPVPARAILEMRGHVISDRLYFSGLEAVDRIQEVYEAVVARVMRCE